MAKTAKPTLTVEELRRANGTLDALLTVRREIKQLEGCIDGRSEVQVVVLGLKKDTDLHVSMRSELLFQDLDDQEARLAGALRRFGVDVPPREAVAAPAQEIPAC